MKNNLLLFFLFAVKNMEQTNQPEQTEVQKKKRNPPKTCPLKHSNFFITINSQKNLGPNSTLSEQEKVQITQQFADVVREFFNLEYKNFIQYEGSRQGEQFGLSRNASKDELITRLVKDPEVEFKFEVGGEQGKLHVHGMICLTKRGVDTKLNFSAIKKFFNDRLGYPVHFNVKLFHDAKRELQAYINKDPFAIVKEAPAKTE